MAPPCCPIGKREDGQILQEGICETGAMASFLAAGTAYAVHGVPTIPFYLFYSIFGFQRVGDMIWACGDMMCRGFLLGGTAGRTTLNGEGLQHQDGHSQVVANTVPNLKSYDPAFAYELAIIVRDGIRRMYTEQEKIFYYITVYNENYPMPAMPETAWKKASCAACTASRARHRQREPGRKVNLFGSGSIMMQVLEARDLLEARGRGDRCLERHQLQRAVPRRHGLRALEPSAPGREPRQPYVRRFWQTNRACSSPRRTT